MQLSKLPWVAKEKKTHSEEMSTKFKITFDVLTQIIKWNILHNPLNFFLIEFSSAW